MKDEKKFFLEFDEDEIEEPDNNKASVYSDLSKRTKIILIAITVVLFTVTAYFGYVLSEKELTNSPAVSDNERNITKQTGLNDVFKIKSFDYQTENNTFFYGKINITKDDIKSMSEAKLNDLFTYISLCDDYNWITVCFEDETGIVAIPMQKNMYFYGKTDENGLLSIPYGTVINKEESGFSYLTLKELNINSLTESNTSTDTDNQIDTRTESTVTVYITPTGTKYHTSSCSYLSDNKTSVSLSKAKEQGYLPCSRCIK